MSGVPFRGVSSNSDARFTDKERKLLKSMKFPKEYEQKVDFSNLNFEAIKPWIAKRVTELLGIEDEVLVGYIYEQFEGVKSVDPRILQINLTGFLEKNTSLFVKELWMLMVSAKDTKTGIPQQLLDEAAAEQKRRRELEETINMEMAARQEKRNAEMREARKEEEREREERRRKREKERQEDLERQRKRREKAREEYEKDVKERARRREEQMQKDRERDRERRKEYEARLEESRQHRRDYGRERDVDRRRDRDRDEAPHRQDRRDLSRLEETARGARNGTGPRADSASVTPPPESKRTREVNGDAREGAIAEPKAKKAKKEKKEKKEKKPKKEKKEKKEKVKAKRESDSPSGSESDISLQGRKSLEDDLRRKALLSVKPE